MWETVEKWHGFFMKRMILLRKCSFDKKEVFLLNRNVLGVILGYFFGDWREYNLSRREICVKYVQMTKNDESYGNKGKKENL